MKKVCLDPGHGVETPGKRSPDGTYFEYEFALDMACRIRDILTRHGVAVTMTRMGDRDVSLGNRVNIANRIPGLDLFVSLHSNAAGSGAQWMAARGLVAYAYGDAVSNRAAENIMARHKEAGVTVRNGGKAAAGKHLYVIRKTNAPAVLVEHLFHDNREDCALLKDDKYRQKMAEADAKGILDFLCIQYNGYNNKEEDDMMDITQFKELWLKMRRELQDNDSGKWSEEARQWATSTGLVAGNGTQVNVEPNYMWEDLLTREQIVTVLYRFAKMMGKA